MYVLIPTCTYLWHTYPETPTVVLSVLVTPVKHSQDHWHNLFLPPSCSLALPLVSINFGYNVTTRIQTPRAQPHASEQTTNDRRQGG